MKKVPITFLTLFLTLGYCFGQPENILLILVDDLGYGDLSITGNPYLETPNIDYLAKSGVTFKNFYVSPVCAPTRASLLTGKYHPRAGVQSVTNGYEVINPEETILAEILSRNNYRNAIIGKWHLGEYYPSVPLAQGFDYFCGFRTGHTAEYFNPHLEVNGSERKFAGFITDILTEQAIDFISKENGNPFFCYLAYNAPHTPLQVDSIYYQPFIRQGLDERTARVYGLIKNLDQNIGRLLQAMKEHNLEKNTLIIFMSDNGPISGWQVSQEEMRYNAGLRDQKFTVYDGGVRTPCFWVAPGYLPVRTIELVSAHIDVLPTVLNILNLEDPEGMERDGQDLLPAIFGEMDDRYFFQHFHIESLGKITPYPGAMARYREWKMVNGEELYNLSRDPGEKNNLSKIMPEQMAELKYRYEEWWSDLVANNSLERKPVLVGFTESSEVVLQPHHATANGNLKFEGKRGLVGDRIGYHPSGVDGDWVVGWNEVGDRLTWQIEIVEKGIFQIDILGEGWSEFISNIQLNIDNILSRPVEYDSEKTALIFQPLNIEKGLHELSVEVVENGATQKPILNALQVIRL